MYQYSFILSNKMVLSFRGVYLNMPRKEYKDHGHVERACA